MEVCAQNLTTLTLVTIFTEQFDEDIVTRVSYIEEEKRCKETKIKRC
jgi:hypothetical protein